MRVKESIYLRSLPADALYPPKLYTNYTQGTRSVSSYAEYPPHKLY